MNQCDLIIHNSLCQENWLEVSRVCGEELVNTWTTANYSMDTLARKQK